MYGKKREKEDSLKDGQPEREKKVRGKGRQLHLKI